MDQKYEKTYPQKVVEDNQTIIVVVIIIIIFALGLNLF